MRIFGGDVALGHYGGGAEVNGGYRQVIAVQHTYAGGSGAIIGRRLTRQLLKADEGRSAFGLVLTGSEAVAAPW